MKNCEYCNEEHDGSYGSGRFCNKKCASGYSTREKRKEINQTVSKKLKERYEEIAPEDLTGYQFKKGFDERRHNLSDEDRKKAVQALVQIRQETYSTLDFIELPQNEKRRVILKEQDDKCGECNINEWLGKPIVLELHHIDGDNSNNTRENLIFLCPNCHSQTDNWRIKKSAR